MDDAAKIAETLFASDAAIEAVRHMDAFALEALVAKAIRGAVAAERERCASIADSEADSAAGRAIAARIREGK